MSLIEFLSSRTRTTERERLLYLTAASELKLYAAQHNACLMLTEPEIDIEGFDFIISNSFENLYIQSKGLLDKRGAKQWAIRSSLLRASFYNRDLMPSLEGQKISGCQAGDAATGGVLLHVIDEEAAKKNQLKISYRYLDIYWLIGVASGIAGVNLTKIKRERAIYLLKMLRDNSDEYKITLKISDFAKLKSLSVLPALRLHIGGYSNWASSCCPSNNLDILEAPCEPMANPWAWGGILNQVELSE